MNSTTANGVRKRSVRTIVFETMRFFKATPYAVSLIWRFQPALLIVLALTTILDGISPVAMVVIMRYFLDSVIAAYQNHGHDLYVKQAVWMLALQIATGCLIAILAKIASLFKGILSSRLCLEMQLDIVKGISRLKMTDFDNAQVYDMIARAKAEAQNNKPLTIVSGVCDVVSSFVTFVAFSCVLFAISPIVLLVMGGICFSYLVLNVYYGNRNYNLQNSRTHEQRAAGYFSACFTDRRALPEIITLDLWAFLTQKWKALSQGFVRQDISLMKQRTFAELAIILFAFVGRGAIYLLILFKCLADIAQFSIGQFLMYIQSFQGGVTALAQLTQQLSGVYEGTCFLQNYQKFQQAYASSQHPPITPLVAPETIYTIEFHNVSFRYPGATTYALHKVNLLFERGKSTLLVGRNGAGKTTLARLLVGLYQPTEGQILINGQDLRNFDQAALKKKISIIFQDFVRYALTLEENIGLGAVEYMQDHERIAKAAASAQLLSIVKRLPHSYTTLLGKEFQDGRDLSLGEWQRVCLARLFMRDASVMIYDEPSASLDVETESELLREIGQLGKSGICILISHRMLRADIADRIVVVEGGMVVEDGKHEALISLGGRYAHLWRTYHQLGTDLASSQWSMPHEYSEPRT